MSDLIAIVRATRASANALAAMAKHARETRDADSMLAYNQRQLAAGHLRPSTAAIDTHIALRRKANAEAAYQRACNRYERAQITLARNPL